MMHPIPLTRFIGEAERTLQAVLQRQLERAGLSFAEWVALTILAGAGSLPRSGLIGAIGSARVVAAGVEGALVESMIQKGLVRTGAELSLAEHGLAVFQPLRSAVREITATLVHDVHSQDLETARRVLETVTKRAAQLLERDPRADGPVNR